MNTNNYTIKEAGEMSAAEPVGGYESYRTVPSQAYSPTSAELASLKRSEEQVKNGELFTDEDVDKMVDEWLA